MSTTATAGGRQTSRPEPERKAVLIAEDNPYSRRLLQLILEVGEYDVDGVADADTLLDRLGRGRYDAVVLDLTLDGCPAGDLVERLERIADCPPIIIHSGAGEDVLAAAARRLGAAAWLQKPASPHVLLGTIGKVVACPPGERGT